MDDMLKVCDEIISRSKRKGDMTLIGLPICYAQADVLAAAYRNQAAELATLRELVSSLTTRIEAQAELLRARAEKPGV